MGEGTSPAPGFSATEVADGAVRGSHRRAGTRPVWPLVVALALLASVPLEASDTSRELDASRRLRERLAVRDVAAALDEAPLDQRDQGSIVVMEHDGSDYSKLESDGTPNYAPRALLAQRFYETHGDSYDFLVVFTNFEFDTGAAVAFHNLVRNDVYGIGRPRVDNGPLFGSPGRLRGYVDMAALSRYATPPFDLEPGSPGYFQAIGVLAHEVGHQWLAQPRYQDGAGVLSPDLLGRDGSHWSYLLDSDASHLYGSEWVPRGDGTWEAVRVHETFSSLDLYLMGFLDPADVGPITLLRNPAIDTTRLPLLGDVVAASAETIDVEQVRAAEGPRVPDHLSSPKEFRLAFVFLTAPGTYPTARELEVIDRFRSDFAGYFFTQTRGVAVADTTLAELPRAATLPGPDLGRAMEWLLGRQASDGRWEDDPATAGRDTASAVLALFRAGQLGEAWAQGMDWLRGFVPTSLDFTARRLPPLAAPGLSVAEREGLALGLAARANGDGGFGPAPGYASDPLDTALALRALGSLDHPVPDVVEKAAGSLAAQVSPSGGWPFVPGGPVSTVVTAEVLLALLEWKEVPTAQQLVPIAQAALDARRNLDGGFGESPSSPYATALAVEALLAARAPEAAVAPGVAWLEASQSTDGSWNGSRYDTALVLGALRSSLTPNLVVPADSFVLDPPAAIEGEAVRATFHVRNAGRASAPGTTARLYAGAPPLGQVLGDSPVPPLEPGAETSVDVVFSTDDLAGSQALFAVADALGALDEAREDDNTAQRNLTVAGLLPDLVVRPSGIAVAPYPPISGEAATVTVQVSNEDEDDSPPSLVRLFLGDPRFGGAFLGEAVLPALDPGAATSVAIPWDTTGVEGEQVLYVVVDATYQVDESDEMNNQAAVVVQVDAVPTEEPDLQVAAVDLDPPELATIPQTVSVVARVRNLGLQPVDARVALFDTDPPVGAPVSELPVSLGPRDSTAVVFTYEVSAPGDRWLVAVADPGEEIPEPDEGNNVARSLLTDPGNTSDVAILPGTTSASPADLVVGETVTVTTRVRNRGTASLTELPVLLELVGLDSMAELDRTLLNLGPGQETDLAFAWETGTTGDPLTLRVRADPFDLLDEVEESNNEATVSVTVRDSPLPNLTVSGADIAIIPDPPLEGAAATVSVLVRNAGVVPAPTCGLAVYRGDPEDGGILLGEARVAGLAAGASTTVEIAWAPVDSGGTLGIFAVVDPFGEVEEYDETDNLAFRPLEVLGLPDLVVTAGDVVVTPAFPRAGETVEVQFTARNLGQRTSPPASWRAVEGEPGDIAGAGELDPLEPGGATAVSFSWTPADPPGERRLSVELDPDQELAESDEGNNLGRRTVVAQDANLYLSPPHFSPDGDGVRDETVLAYRVVGAGAVDVIVSNSRGRELFRLREAAPPEGSIAWNGRTPEGFLLPDGNYTLTLTDAEGAVLGRAVTALDLNRLPVHEVAGLPRVAIQTMTCSFPEFEGPAFAPAEDEAFYVVKRPTPPPDPEEFPPGLVRVNLDGGPSYLFQDEWYDEVTFVDPGAVSPDGREILLRDDREVWSVDLLTGERRLVTSLSWREHEYDAKISWSPDGAFIYTGQRIVPRDGGESISLPEFGGWAWSPDGLSLARFNWIVSRDLSSEQIIYVPAPNPYFFYRALPITEWLPDGRITAYLFEQIYETDELAPVATSRDASLPEGCSPSPDELTWACAFVLDPRTHDVAPLPWLAERVLTYEGNPGPYVRWSPSGDRVLYTGGYYDEDERVVTWPRSDVAYESGLGSRRLAPPFVVEASPRATIGFVEGRSGQDGVSSSCAALEQSLVVRNLENLTAALRVSRLPGNSGVLLRGIASDRHLERWQIEYTKTDDPEGWQPIGPAFDTPVLDEPFGAWVPPSTGEFALRLTVYDHAGNSRSRARIVAWTRFPALSNFAQTERLISPNGDGVRDEVTFSYIVQEPSRLDVQVRGPLASNPDAPRAPVVRSFAFEHPEIGGQSFAWDGRDDAGQVLPDGRYEVLFNGLPLYVDLDSTPPDIAWAWEDLRLEREGATTPRGLLVADRVWHVWDDHLDFYEAVPEPGAPPMGRGTSPVYDPEVDSAGEVVFEDGVPRPRRVGDRLADVRETSGRIEVDGVHPLARFRASDHAGNVSEIPIAPVDEGVFLRHARAGSTNRLLPPRGSELDRLPVDSEFHLSETIRDTPPEGEAVRLRTQPLAGGAWTESPPMALNQADSVRPDLLSLGLLPGGSYRGRFACDDDGVERQSTPFSFQVCEQFMRLESGSLSPGGPPTGAVHEVLVRGNDPAVQVTISLGTWDYERESVRPTRLSGGGVATGLPTQEIEEGRFIFTLPGIEEPFCRIAAHVRGASGRTYGGNDADEVCKRLVLNECPGGAPPSGGSGEGKTILSVEPVSCWDGSPDVRVLEVRNATPDPVQLALVADPDGLDVLLAEVDLVPGGTRKLAVGLEALPEGGVTIAARDRGGETIATVRVAVDRTEPDLSILQPVEGEVPCLERDPRSGREWLPVVFLATDAARVVRTEVEYRTAEDEWRAGSAGVFPTGEVATLSWDVTQVPDGQYRVRLRACDGRGNVSAAERWMVVGRDPPVLEVVGVDREMFSPNGDGRGDSVTATFRTHQALRLTATVRADGVEGDVVDTLFTDRTLGDGSLPLTWDGRDPSDEPAPDGVYHIRLEARTACGQTAFASTSVTVDNLSPEIEILSPVHSATVFGSLEVTGVARDRNMRSWTLESQPNAQTLAVADYSVGSEEAPSLLAHWTTPDDPGPYQLVLRAEDRAENTAELIVPVNVGPRRRLDRLAVVPALFSPNGDGRREEADIEYDLLYTSRVRLEVTRESAVVRTLVADVEQPTGSYVVPWDGRDDLGGEAPDGPYRVVITVVDPEGVAEDERTDLGVEIDRAPPTALVLQPEADAVLDRADGVVGTVDDPNLARWSVVVDSRPDPLATGSEVRIDAVLAPLSALEDGPYTLELLAEDAAENRSQETVPFALDSVPPVAVLAEPPPDSVWPKTAPVEVIGNATDANLVSWRLSFGAGPEPADFVELARGSEGGVALSLASWDVTSLPDGDYLLRLEVTDLAGHVSEVRRVVAVDGTAPHVAIARPPEGAYLTEPGPVEGSVIDDHLESWELEIAPGAAAEAFAWSPVAAGTDLVAEDLLGSLDPLPPDGVHTLRLTARDRAGNASEALRTTTIDTTPPTPPTPRAEVVPDGSGAADVILTWDPSPEPDVAGYRVYRPYAPLTDLVPDPTHTDAGVADGDYTYRVRAEDQAGNRSSAGRVSVRVDVTPPRVDLLHPPAGALVSGTVDIRGTAWSADDFAEYRLYVGAGSAPVTWTLLRRATVPVQGSVLGTWTALGNGPWVVALEAEDTTGNQARVEQPIVVDTSPPSAPALLSVEVDAGPADLRATWQPSPEPDVSGYLVYRGGVLANGPGLVLGDLKPYEVPPPSYLDATLPDGRHCYSVVAADEAGNLSPWSNEICRDLDTRTPRAEIVDPPDGTRFDHPIRILAFTPDTDVASVQFQLKPEADATWQDLGAADTQEPWEVTLDPEPLALGVYHLRAVATDSGPPPKTDPDPPAISVAYGDATPPSIPVDLEARVDGRQVTLTWAPSPEPDVAGYRLHRAGEAIGGILSAPEYVDERDPGEYSYTVQALDVDDNESGASAPAYVTVYQLSLTPVYPVTSAAQAALAGAGGRPATSTVAILREGVEVATGPAAGESFVVPDVPLVFDGNRLAARGEDADGNRSIPSEELVLIRNQPPGTVSDLQAVSGPGTVDLAWTPPPDPDLVGFRVRRDGEPATTPTHQEEAASLTSSSDISPSYGPERAWDGSTSTAWGPRGAQRDGGWWQVTFPEPIPVEAIEIHFSTYYGSARPASAHRVEVAWDDRFLPVVVAPSGPSPAVQYDLPAPFTTDAIRITLVDPDYGMGLAEVRVTRAGAVPAGPPAWTDEQPLRDGDHEYEVTALDRYGADGPWVSATVAVDRLAAPTGLEGVAEASDAVLTWNAHPEPDIDHYRVFREGERIGEAPLPSYRDPELPNADYEYTVSAVDVEGNESEPSSPATVRIEVVGLVAPVLTATATPRGYVDLDWDHPGAPFYALYRATTPGGPYSLLARTPEREHTDTTAPLGVEHFYVVLAEDELGNPSPTSNEVSAVPERTDPLDAPVIFFPTDAAHPITLDEDVTLVRGVSDPGAEVQLFVNGEPTFPAIAGGRFDAQGITPLEPDLARAFVTLDGRRLAQAVFDPSRGAHVLRVSDLATGVDREVSTAPYLDFWPLGLSPSGERLLLNAWGTDEDPGADDLVFVDLHSGAVTAVDDGPRVTPEATWSPDGQRVAYVSLDPFSGDCQFLVRDLAFAEPQALDVGGCPFSPSWSPSGAEIAFVAPQGDQLELRVVAADGSTAPRTLDLEPASELRWSSDGRQLIYTTPEDGWHVRVIDVETGVRTDLGDETSDGRFSLDGRWISYVEATPGGLRLVALNQTSGEVVPVRSGFTGRQVHEWTTPGYIAFGDTSVLALYPAFEGAFQAAAYLEGGLNTLVAVATEPVGGLVSPDSEPVDITVSGVLADLEIVETDIGAAPLVPLVARPAQARVRVRNVGAVRIDEAPVLVRVYGPLGGLVLEEREEVEDLDPGGSDTVAVDWLPLVPGAYSIFAVADAGDYFAEAREDNNSALRRVDVAAGPGLLVSVEADREAYPVRTLALATVRVVNAGDSFSGEARLVVQDPSGAEVALLDTREVALAYGGIATWSAVWNTGNTYAGDYAFRLRVLDPLGAESATGAASFRILPEVAVSARLVPDSATVPGRTPAVFQARVENHSSNAVLEGAVARLSVVAAGTTDPVLFELTALVPALPPQGGWDGVFTWPEAAPAGDLVAVLEVLDETETLARSTAPFEVTAAAGRLSGSIAGVPENVLEGDPFEARVVVVNEGQAALYGHPAVIEMVSGPDATVPLAEALSLDLEPGQSLETDVPLASLGLSPGPYTLRLRAGDPALTLARAPLRIHGLLTPPSPDGPPDGGRVDTSHPVLSVNNASSGEGAPLTYEFEIFADESLTNPRLGVSGVEETPSHTAWRVAASLVEDTRYWWRARATDGFSTSGWTEVWSFLVDALNEAPGAPVAVSPLLDERVASLQPPLVARNSFDPELDVLSYEFRLARDPDFQTIVASATGVVEGDAVTTWPLPVSLEEDETYCWSARASDGPNLSPWSGPACFLVDLVNQVPSAPVPLRPVGGTTILTVTPALAVGPAADPEGSSLTYVFEIDTTAAFDSPARQSSAELPEAGPETAWTPPIPLRDNTLYHWRSAASDGSQRGPWAVETFFVNYGNDLPSAPVLLDPVAGAAVATFTPALRLRNAIDPDQEALVYDFEVVDDAGALVTEVTGIPEAPDETEWTVPASLEEGRVYEWRARARDAEDAGEWAPWESFRVRVAPTAPGLVAPVEGEEVDTRQPALVVSNAASPRGATLTYSFELSSVAPDGATTLVDSVQGLPEGVASTSWTSVAALPDGGYAWRARAFDGALFGPWMPTARFSVSVDQPPAPPTGLTAAAGDARVGLEWTASLEPDVVAYRLYRALASGGPFGLVVETAEPEHVDPGLANGTTYYYVVTALDARFESEYSLEVAATPEAPTTVVEAEVRFRPRRVAVECLLSEGCRVEDHHCPRRHVAGHQRDEGVEGAAGSDRRLVEEAARLLGLELAGDAWRGGGCGDDASLVWSDDLRSCGPSPPEVRCPDWVRVTIELPPGYAPADIDLSTVRLAGSVSPHPRYRRFVDSDRDGIRELKVRFAFADVVGLIQPGSNAVIVTGTVGGQDFEGAGRLEVVSPQVNVWMTPRVLRQSHRCRGHQGHEVVADLRVPDCMDARDIDVSSIRLNETVPVRGVLQRRHGRLRVSFDRSRVIAVLPAGCQVEVRINGTIMGVPFVAIDHIQVRE